MGWAASLAGDRLLDRCVRTSAISSRSTSRKSFFTVSRSFASRLISLISCSGKRRPSRVCRSFSPEVQPSRCGWMCTTPCKWRSPRMRLTCRTRSRRRFARERCKRFMSSSSGRNTHDAAGLAFASMPSHEHPNETLCVGAVGLEPTPAPAHLDACRIKHAVADPPRNQQAIEPEAVIPRFIASVDLGSIAALSRHSGARPVEKTKQALGVPAGNLEQANLVEMRHAKSDNPLRLAQLDCHENLSTLESALSALSSQSSHRALLVSPPKHQRCPKTERSPMESPFASEGQSFQRRAGRILWG